MDFEEWFKKRHTKTGLYEKSLFGDDDSLYLKHEMKKAFKAGQQSKQAEIDKLKMSNHYLSVQVLDAEAYAEYWQKRSSKSQVEIDAFKKKICSALELMRQPMQGTVADLLSELEDILNDT